MSRVQDLGRIYQLIPAFEICADKVNNSSMRKQVQVFTHVIRSQVNLHALRNLHVIKLEYVGLGNFWNGFKMYNLINCFPKRNLFGWWWFLVLHGGTFALHDDSPLPHLHPHPSPPQKNYIEWSDSLNTGCCQLYGTGVCVFTVTEVEKALNWISER